MNDVLRRMSTEQQIGQLLMAGFPGKTATPDILRLIELAHVGGIILFSHNVASAQQTRDLIARLQEAARGSGHPFPLLIATDQENGIVHRMGDGTTLFPGNMALGAIGSEEAAEAAARATGEELRSLGVTMNLAPVVDIANNPANPVIGVRSFGADPDLVARLGAAATRGYQSAGVAATLKHFPGHGDTAVDSHLALPVVPFERERLESVEMVPFRRAIAAGADAIMTAHVALPAVTGSDTTPATLSPEVIHGLLRARLGYDGVVITDCLEMRAISDGVGVARGAVGALLAGADIALISHHHARQMAGLGAIRQAVASGQLAPERIQAAVERVLRLKQRLLTWDQWESAAASGGLDGPATPEHQRLADDLYARSITLIRDEASLLPLRLRDGMRLLVVSESGGPISNATDRRFVPGAFVDALNHQFHARAGRATSCPLPEHPTREDFAALRERAASADVVILLTCNAHLPRQHAASMATVRALLEASRPLIGVAVCDPYDAMALPQVGTWLATYDFMPPALEAAARVLVGSDTAPGSLPVTW